MGNTVKYIGVLVAFIGGAMGYTYATSEVREIEVTGKRIDTVQMRRGREAKRYVIETRSGDLSILSFPVIGYSTDTGDIYDGIQTGDTLKVRLGSWPPLMSGESRQTRIMSIY